MKTLRDHEIRRIHVFAFDNNNPESRYLGLMLLEDL